MGKCGVCWATTPGTFRLCYYCWKKKENKMAALHGWKRCPKCGTSITQNRSLCGRCARKRRYY